MPRKVRDLLRDLENHGFVNCGRKGSHGNYRHPSGANITVSGKPGDDAKPYQERAVRTAIEEAEQ